MSVNIGIRVGENDKTIVNAMKVIRERQRAMMNWRTPLGMISTQMYRSIMLNFQTEGGRTPGGKWLPLSPVTIALRRKGKGQGSPRILQDTGFLRGSIIPTYDENQAIAGTNLNYALIHQFGIGRRRVNIPAYTRKDGVNVRAHTKMNPPIPARPFMVLNESDKKKIYGIALRVLKGEI